MLRSSARQLLRRGSPFLRRGTAAAAAGTPSLAVSSLLLPLPSSDASPLRHHHHCCHSLHRCQRRRTPTLLPARSGAAAGAAASSRRAKSTFVSRHNRSLDVSPREILRYCRERGLLRDDRHRVTASHVVLRECPFCPRPTGGKPDNLYKCYVSAGTGAYFCHRCGSAGSWFDFKSRLNGPSGGGGTAAAAAAVGTPSGMGGGGGGTGDARPLPMPSPRLQAAYSSRLLDDGGGGGARGDNAVLRHLTEARGLRPQTLRKYGVGRATYSFAGPDGRWTQQECVTFPWLLTVRDIQRQEELRGAAFAWKKAPPSSNGGGAGGDDALATEGDGDESELENNTYLTRRIKVRSVECKAHQRMDPPGGGWGLFGLHTVPADARSIVLTEGEYDAMAVSQATGRPAVSLPNGCRSLPVQVLPLLEEFDRIYLWMDNDAAGQEGAELFARKLGLGRCYLVRPTAENCRRLSTTDDKPIPLPKDANEALLQGLDLNLLLDDAALIPHERILQFDDLRESVLHEILHPEKYVGVPVTSLPGLTSILKGLRRGELTVITGATGSGKTTFLGQLSLDLAEQDINVLWGSFEIKNTRLMHKLLQQFAREPLPVGDATKTSRLEALADRFSQLPLTFMKFHGGTDVDDVLEAMEYAVYVNDVEHIILDNMQFMVSRGSMTGSFDKFDVQDVAIEKFRKFATDKNVHVTLVVHPRKEQEHMPLTMASIYGSAKATQEADTVLILQNDGRRKQLEVKKNRFNGTLGRTPLFFDSKACRYSETPVMGGEYNATSPSQQTPARKPQASSSSTHWDSSFH